MANSLTKKQQNFAVCISLLFIFTACGIIYIFDATINNFLLIAGVLLSMGIALLGFLIVGIFRGNGEIIGITISEMTGGFLLFIVVLTIWLKFYQTDKPKLTLENPQELSIWSKANEKFQWFNALYVLASEKHSKVQYENIKNKKVIYELLLFDCFDSVQRKKDFLFKFNKMCSFLKNMDRFAKNDNIDLKNYVKIAIKKTNNIPTISFFKTKLDNKSGTPYIVMYLNEVFKSTRPDRCFISEDFEIATHYNEIFSNNWDEAIELNVEKILKDSTNKEKDWNNFILE